MRGIGIDIERIPNDSGLEAIRSTALIDRERLLINELANALGEPAALTLVFSAKESFYKAVAKTVGRVFDFDVVEVVGIEDDRSLDLIVTADLSTDLTRGRRFQVSMSRIDARTVMTACAW